VDGDSEPSWLSSAERTSCTRCSATAVVTTPNGTNVCLECGYVVPAATWEGGRARDEGD
jgi:hypothetical protein